MSGDGDFVDVYEPIGEIAPARALARMLVGQPGLLVRFAGCIYAVHGYSAAVRFIQAQADGKGKRP